MLPERLAATLTPEERAALRAEAHADHEALTATIQALTGLNTIIESSEAIVTYTEHAATWARQFLAGEPVDDPVVRARMARELEKLLRSLPSQRQGLQTARRLLRAAIDRLHAMRTDQ